MSCKDSPKYNFNACRKELRKATDRIYIPSKCPQHSISNWLKGSPLPKFVLILVQPFMPLLGEQISSHIRLRLRQDEAIPVWSSTWVFPTSCASHLVESLQCLTHLGPCCQTAIGHSQKIKSLKHSKQTSPWFPSQLRNNASKCGKFPHKETNTNHIKIWLDPPDCNTSSSATKSKSNKKVCDVRKGFGYVPNQFHVTHITDLMQLLGGTFFASGCIKLFHLLRSPTADWTHLPDQSIGQRGSWPRLDNASVGVVISIQMLYQEGSSTLKPLGEYWVNTDIPHVQNARVKEKL